MMWKPIRFVQRIPPMVRHVHPIARINIPFDQEHPTNTFTVVKVLMSQAEAEAEVSRLNQVNAGKSSLFGRGHPNIRKTVLHQQ